MLCLEVISSDIVLKMAQPRNYIVVDRLGDFT